MKLTEVIKNTIIQNQKPIGFDEFMELALYFPQLGYYRSGSEKFGEKGDFITAPETLRFVWFLFGEAVCSNS